MNWGLARVSKRQAALLDNLNAQEALTAATDEFKAYGAQVAKNAKRLAESLMALGYDLAGGGTDTSLVEITLDP